MENSTQQLVSVKEFLQASNIQQMIERSISDESKRVTFRTSLLSLVNQNQDLSKADPMTILTAALEASTLNLPINKDLGYAWIIAYGQNAQLQIGWKGFVQLALRTGEYKTINVTEVKEGEFKSIDRLSGESVFEWIDDELVRVNKKTIGYVAYFELLNGFRKSLYMTKEQVNTHGERFSKTFGTGVWKKDYDAMAKKTVLKNLLNKFGPKSTELVRAIEVDQSIVNKNRNAGYPDNPNGTQNMTEASPEERSNSLSKFAQGTAK